MRIRPTLRCSLLALGSYTVLAAILTWPLIFFWRSAIPGSLWDNWQNYWNLWWGRQSLLVMLINPFQTDYQLYPLGASLYFHTLALPDVLFALPIVTLLDVAAGYNALIFLAFVFNGYTVYLLSLYLTRNRPAAFVVGLAFAFAPIHYLQATAQLELISAPWLVLSVLGLVRLVREPSRAALAMAIAALILATLTSYYFAFSLFFFVGLLIVPWGIIHNRGARLRGFIGRLSLTLLVSALLLLPVLIPTLVEATQASYVASPRLAFILNSVDLLEFFTAKGYSYYWGATVIGLAVLGVLGRWRASRLWFAATLLYVLLSLGPILHIGGESEFGGTTISLPYDFLFNLPLGQIGRTPNRQTAMATLMVDVLAGYGITWVLARLNGVLRFVPRLRWLQTPGLWIALLGLWICVESPTLPLPMTAISTGDGCPTADMTCLALDGEQKLLSLPGTALLDIPAIELISTPDLVPMDLYLAGQTLHKKKIVQGYLARMPLDPFIAAVPIEFRRLSGTPSDDILRQSDQSIASFFQYYDIRTVVLHRDFLATYGLSEQAIISRLRALFGPQLTQLSDNGPVAIYQLAKTDSALTPFMTLWANWYDRSIYIGRPARWTTNDGALRIINPRPAPMNIALSFEAVALGKRRTVEVRLNAEPHWMFSLPSDAWAITRIPLTLEPGENNVEWHSLEPPQQPDNGDSRFLSMAFAQIKVDYGAQPAFGDRQPASDPGILLFENDGWSIREAWGQWALGRYATMWVSGVDRTRDYHLTLQANPYCPQPFRGQAMHVSWNDHVLGAARFASCDGQRFDFDVPAAYIRTGLNMLSFDFETAAVPLETDRSGDRRALAVGFSAIQITKK